MLLILTLHFCICPVQNSCLDTQVREVEWEDSVARPDSAGTSTCRQGNESQLLKNLIQNLVLLISWVSSLSISSSEFLLFSCFSIFFPTIETVDVIIVHNKMELKELIWNYCKLFNLWQMINLSKLSAVSNFKLNFYIYIFADICAVSKGYLSAWGTEEFLSTRCWNTVELFINLYWFRKYCGTKSFAVFTEICFSGVLWKDIPMHWHKSFNLQTCFLWKGQNFAASICFISCFLF